MQTYYVYVQETTEKRYEIEAESEDAARAEVESMTDVDNLPYSMVGSDWSVIDVMSEAEHDCQV